MPDDLWKPETGPENRGRRKAWGALPPSGARVAQVDYNSLHRRKNRRSSSRKHSLFIIGVRARGVLAVSKVRFPNLQVRLLLVWSKTALIFPLRSILMTKIFEVSVNSIRTYYIYANSETEAEEIATQTEEADHQHHVLSAKTVNVEIR